MARSALTGAVPVSVVVAGGAQSSGIGLTIVKSLVEVLGGTTAFGRSVALGGLQVTAYFK